MKRSVFMALLIASLSIPALPQYYSNGPINGTVDAWTINFGFVVSDSFTFNSPGGRYQLSFGAWLFPGDVHAKPPRCPLPPPNSAALTTSTGS